MMVKFFLSILGLGQSEKYLYHPLIRFGNSYGYHKGSNKEFKTEILLENHDCT